MSERDFTPEDAVDTANAADEFLQNKRPPFFDIPRWPESDSRNLRFKFGDDSDTALAADKYLRGERTIEDDLARFQGHEVLRIEKLQQATAHVRVIMGWDCSPLERAMSIVALRVLSKDSPDLVEDVIDFEFKLIAQMGRRAVEDNIIPDPIKINNLKEITRNPEMINRLEKNYIDAFINEDRFIQRRDKKNNMNPPLDFS